MAYNAAVPPVELERHLRTEDSQLFLSVGSSFNCSAPLKTESSCRRLDSAESHEGILKISSKDSSPSTSSGSHACETIECIPIAGFLNFQDTILYSEIPVN